VWIDVEPATAVGQLILWATGEVDLRVGDRKSGDLTVNAHRAVESADELDDAVRDLIAAR
jgi:hypothetical protein